MGRSRRRHRLQRPAGLPDDVGNDAALATSARAVFTDYSGGDRAEYLDSGNVQLEASRSVSDLNVVFPGALARPPAGQTTASGPPGALAVESALARQLHVLSARPVHDHRGSGRVAVNNLLLPGEHANWFRLARLHGRCRAVRHRGGAGDPSNGAAVESVVRADLQVAEPQPSPSPLPPPLLPPPPPPPPPLPHLTQVDLQVHRTEVGPSEDAPFPLCTSPYARF